MSEITHTLPKDWRDATLVGRIWHPAQDGHPIAGPSVVTINDDHVFDVTPTVATVAELLAMQDPADVLETVYNGEPLCSVEVLIANSTTGDRDKTRPYLLAPIDLQAIKAAGVTFASSLIERIIEERAEGDFSRATALREELSGVIGDDLSNIVPGSEEAKALETHLRAQGYWSQYLEVGIGPDAEVFSKSQVLSAVGTGADIGLHPTSEWNNPEPEVVLVVTPDQRIVGATLGNDVNLRDIEGRSALLLGRAKDNNASCALGPFIRLFDEGFTLDHVRNEPVALRVEGADGYTLDGASTMAEISRDVADLVTQTAGKTHQYPDGFVLMTGTLFAPTQDRGTPGMGFTHTLGDVVKISSPHLGTLANTVTTSDVASP